jgi:hypothetical protein
MNASATARQSTWYSARATRVFSSATNMLRDCIVRGVPVSSLIHTSLDDRRMAFHQVSRAAPRGSLFSSRANTITRCAAL